jgi:hypothetical protein
MPLNIPMPSLDRSGLFEGLLEGHKRQYAQKQFQQQWQQHLQNMEVKRIQQEIQQQQQARLAEQFEMQKELHPYALREAEQKEKQGPAKLDLVRAQYEAQKALAEQRRTGKTQDPLRQQRTQQLINSHQWNSSPSTVKDAMVAYANGIGIRPDEAVAGFTAGKTLEEMAAERGMNPEDVSQSKVKYLATSGNVKIENERQKKVAELNVLEDRVTDAMAPYIKTFYGKSPEFIMDAFKGRNTDDLARYLAARALQPEMASLRINVMGGNVGHGAIEDIVHAALGKSDIPQSLVTPEIYKKMNHYAKEWLNEASQAATESVYGRGKSRTQSSESNDNDPLGLR